MIPPAEKEVQNKDATALAIDSFYHRNRWLTRIRWIYTFFILLFFNFYGFFLNKIYIKFHVFLLILLLSVLGNTFFFFFLRMMRRKTESTETHLKKLSLLTSVQLDFDFVVLSLFILFSGGFDSPVIVLFIFYIMVATFTVDFKKSFLNTIVAIVFISVIFFKSEGFSVTPQRLATVVAFDFILLFAFFISAYLSKNMRQNEKILRGLLKKTRELSITDGLTQLFTQSHFFEVLQQEHERSRRYKYTYSIVILDVDYFKEYNDNNGHLHGSRALEKIGTIMKLVFRTGDTLAKYGGDEFVVILPHTDKVGAFLAADRLREMVEVERFQGVERQPEGKLTLSLGVSSYPEHGVSPEEILAAADKALYAAKRMGRNRTVIFADEIESPD